MIVRKLTVDDLDVYRALHRFALTEAPLAFVETPRNDEARSDSVVHDMLARGEAWGVFEGERLFGKMVIDALPYDCLAHTRWLHAVYLHPDVRGSGAGELLVRTAIEDARRTGAGVIALWVNAENAPAARFYARLGFMETGRVPGGIAIGGRRVDDVMMCLPVAG